MRVPRRPRVSGMLGAVRDDGFADRPCEENRDGVSYLSRSRLDPPVETEVVRERL